MLELILEEFQMAPLTRSKATTSMIPSPTQQQSRPRAYRKTNNAGQSTAMNEVVSAIGESADFPSDAQSHLDSQSPLVDVSLVAQSSVDLSCSTTTGDLSTPQAHSRSFRHRTPSFLTSIRRRRRTLFNGGRGNEIRLSTDSRLRNLEYTNSRLQLRLCLLEPVVGRCATLEARISELEKIVEEMSKSTTTSLDGTTDAESHSLTVDDAASTSHDDERAALYPPPNEATTGGMWYTINSTRYWVKSKQDLIRLKKRCKRAERRRESRRTRRQRTGDRLNQQNSQQRREQSTGQQRRQRRRTDLNSIIQSTRHRRPPSSSPPDTQLITSVTHSQQQHLPTRPQTASHGQPEPPIREATSPSNDEIPLRMHTPTNETWLYISGVANDVTAADDDDDCAENGHDEVDSRSGRSNGRRRTTNRRRNRRRAERNVQRPGQIQRSVQSRVADEYYDNTSNRSSGRTTARPVPATGHSSRSDSAATIDQPPPHQNQLEPSSSQQLRSTSIAQHQMQGSTYTTDQGSLNQAPEQRQTSSSESVQAAPTDDDIPLRMHTPNKETWIYISRVTNDVTEADLKDYISRKLHRQDIECHLLLSKDIDPRSRQTISFKARIPSSCAYIALHSSFWPSGVNVRYFVSAKDF